MGKLRRHGVSIGLERLDNEVIYLKLRVIGKLTHDDYKVLAPMLDNAVKSLEHPQIQALVDLLDMDGWEFQAAWDDFKLGMKHGREFSKIAIVGDKPWEQAAAKVAGWFISGESQYFDDIDDAAEWLSN